MNVVKFFTTLSIILYVFALFSAKGKKPIVDGYKKGEHLPAWADSLFYLSMIIMLVGFGHWVMAVCWTLVYSADSSFREEANKK